jgi:hypothetical protein
MKTLAHYTLIAITIILLSACAGHQIDIYQDRKPALIPKEFFNGKLTAHGVLKNRDGEVTRTFNATINAYWKDGVGTLEEVFIFDDGEVQYRTWKLQPTKNGGYNATAGDVIGEGIAGISGNAMNLNYVLRIKYNNDTLDLSVDDWMFLVDENTIINESVLTKWGIRVASIQLAIVKNH